MKRLMPIALVLALAVGAYADNTTRATTTNVDHSAFFNGAGYQGDIPVTVGPTSRITIRTNGAGRNCTPPPRCWYPRSNYWVNWSPPVRANWIPGHYEWTTQRVWIEPTWTTEYVPPVYQYGYEGSRQIQILVREGYYQRVQIPGHYEDRQVQVWIEGYWQRY